MSGPNAEGGSVLIGASLVGARWPVRLRVDAHGVRIVCGFAICDGTIVDLEPHEAESWPFDAITLAEIASDHAAEFCTLTKN